MSKSINNIKEELAKTSLQVTALALYLDVNESTISKWNSNIEQPSLKRLDEVGNVLEANNIKLIKSVEREPTGLADALQREYKRLLKSGLSKKVKGKDKNGNEIEINNPEFVKALRDFVAKYRQEHK